MAWLRHSPLSATSGLRNAIYCVLPGERWLQGGNVGCLGRLARLTSLRCAVGCGGCPLLLRYGSLRPSYGGAEDTEERVFTSMVYDMVSSITSPHAICGEQSFLFPLDQPEGGFLVKSMRLIPTNMVGRRAKESDCCGSYVKRASTISATVYEVQGEVLSGGEGLDVGCRCGLTSPRT